MNYRPCLHCHRRDICGLKKEIQAVFDGQAGLSGLGVKFTLVNFKCAERIRKFPPGSVVVAKLKNFGFYENLGSMDEPSHTEVYRDGWLKVKGTVIDHINGKVQIHLDEPLERQLGRDGLTRRVKVYTDRLQRLLGTRDLCESCNKPKTLIDDDWHCDECSPCEDCRHDVV